MEGSDSRLYKGFFGLRTTRDFSESPKDYIRFTLAFRHTQKGKDIVAKKMRGIRFLDFLKDYIEKSDAVDAAKELMLNYINCAQRDVAEGKTYQALSDILHLEKNYIYPLIVKKLPNKARMYS